MKISENIKRDVCDIPENEIREYAKAKAMRIMDSRKSGFEEWRESTPFERKTLEALIYGGILAGRFNRNGNGDMTPDTIRNAANTSEFTAHSFFRRSSGEIAVNCAYSVYYPVIDWFKEHGAY